MLMTIFMVFIGWQIASNQIAKDAQIARLKRQARESK